MQFDTTRAAGFTEALRIALLAEQHGVMLAPHTAPELHGHLLLAAPRCIFGVESHGGPETDPLAYGLFCEHPELRDGHLHLGDSPGFGLEVDWIEDVDPSNRTELAGTYEVGVSESGKFTSSSKQTEKKTAADDERDG